MALELHLTDLVEREALQEIQDTFAMVSGATVVIVDPDGQPVTRASNWNRFCGIFSGRESSGSVCESSIHRLIAQNKETGRVAIEQCPHVGLMTAAMPIVLDGMYLGSWVFGQLRIEDPSEKQLQLASRELGLSVRKARRMLEELPVITREEFDNMISFLASMHQLVVRLGHSNATAVAALAELRAVNALQESHWNMLRKFVDSSEVALYICEFETGKILMANEYYCKQAGMSMDEMVGQYCWEVNGLSQDMFFTYCPLGRLVDQQGNPTGPYTWSYYNDKFGVWLSCTGQAIAWENETMAHMITQMDVSKEHEIQELLSRAAYYDRYTKLPNAEKLAQDLELLKYQEEAERTLICLHISNMHNINNIYGRQTGHDLLKAISRWLLAKDYPESAVYRTEGYGFCLVLDDADTHRAKAIAEEINARFADAWHLDVDGQPVYYFCTVAMSIICLSESIRKTDILNLIDRTLLGSAKRQDILIYDEDMDRLTKKQIEFEVVLKNCIKSGMEGFDVHYQPIVDTQTGGWKGLEALCRWRHPELGDIPPGEFIPEAERMGLIGILGEWVLETAVRQCKEYNLDEQEDFFLSVNISAMQLLDEYFADKVLDLLAIWCFPGNKLSLEITESVELSTGSYACAMIERLQEHGVRMALDDFGTGYASFNTLRNLPVSFVKTERNFVDQIEQDARLQYCYYVISEIAHSDKMMMIAEGIETREQMEVIRNNGADYIQGYYYSKPLDSGQLGRSLEQFTRPDRPVAEGRDGDMNRWLGGQGAYIVTPGLLGVLNQCMQVFLSKAELGEMFHNALRIVGEHFRVDRAFAYFLEEEWDSGCYHEWRDTGVRRLFLPFKDGGDLEELLDCLSDQLRRDGMINAGNIANLPPELYDALHPLDVNSAMLVPIWDEGVLGGVVGLYHSSIREWSAEEIIMLWNLSIVMESTMRREVLKSQVNRKHNLLVDILKNAGLRVFVGDVDTREIIWVNDHMRREYQDEDSLEGKKCYQVLQGGCEQCSFCKIQKLVENPALGQLSYEYYDEDKGKAYIVYNSLVQWEDDRRVFVEYTMDVTEHLNTQRQIEYYATTDVLTGAMNRNSLLERLKMQVREAGYDNSFMSIAYVDVDDLKSVNASCGNIAGDRILCQTVSAIRENIRRDDIIGRVGGDEFVVIFPGCRKSQAIERMLGARETLLEKYCGEVSVQFSFGVAENAELPYQDPGVAASGLMQVAEQRMRASRFVGETLVSSAVEQGPPA